MRSERDTHTSRLQISQTKADKNCVASRPKSCRCDRSARLAGLRYMAKRNIMFFMLHYLCGVGVAMAPIGRGHALRLLEWKIDSEPGRSVRGRTQTLFLDQQLRQVSTGTDHDRVLGCLTSRVATSRVKPFFGRSVGIAATKHLASATAPNPTPRSVRMEPDSPTSVG